MSPASEAWPRAVRLKRRRLIRPLFAQRCPHISRIRVGTVQLLYRMVPQHLAGTPSPVQVGFAVGRQRTKVRRNRLRRVLRETFRTHKARAVLRGAGGRTLTLMVLCRSGSAEKRSPLRADLEEALNILAARIGE